VNNIVLGAVAAIVIAFTLAVPSVHGISTWKYVLAAIGVMLFVVAGRDTPLKP
jgi:uncharacterized membrane protein YeiH